MSFTRKFLSRFFRFQSGTVILLLFLTCGAAQAVTENATGAVIGSVTTYKVQPDDNLYALARRFDLGIVALLAANPDVDPWLPKEGTELTLPTMHILPNAARRGIVINLSELRLYYFPDPHTVKTFPIGIGREGWETPVGHTIVVGKKKHPEWIPPPSIRKEKPELPAVFPPGPNNPLGDYALDLGWPEYRIHGTNWPYGVGKRVSHGCIRLYPEDIAALFPLIRIGTPVTIVDAHYRLGWKDRQLWLEVTPTQKQTDLIADYEKPAPIDIPQIDQAVTNAAGQNATIDWRAVDKAVKQPDGVPVVVARQTGE